MEGQYHYIINIEHMFLVRASRILGTEGSQRRYDVDSYLEQSRPAQTVCYCRVSGKKQSADLDRQVAFMRERYPDAEIVSDVGSGSTSGRKGTVTAHRNLH